MATPSIKEVAHRAGVSVGTVSNVLNRPWIVAPATRQRVQDSISALGFVRNEAARHLRAGRSRTVGLVVLDVANPFFTDLAEGAESLAYEHDTVVMLCNSKTDPVREGHHLDQLEQQRVLGILITPFDSNDPRLTALVARGTPVVLVDRAADRGLCSVSVDDQLGGRLAGNHLIESGHRRIAFVGGPFTMQQVSDRMAGITTVVEQAGDVDLQLFEVDVMGVVEGRTIGEKVAAMPARSRPTAAFIANDLLALGFLQAMSVGGPAGSPRHGDRGVRRHRFRPRGRRTSVIGAAAGRTARAVGDGAAAGGGRGGRPASPSAGDLPAGPDRQGVQ